MSTMGKKIVIGSNVFGVLNNIFDTTTFVRKPDGAVGQKRDAFDPEQQRNNAQ